jgi:LysM repeat protein
VALLGAATLQAQQVTDTTKRANAVVDTAAVDTAAVDTAAHPTALAPDTGAAQAKTDTSTRATTDTTARHTVKKGDTLWDLANFYLRNPFLWPQIYKLNTDIVRNPHWIYPGQRLRLPNGQTIVVGEQTKPDSTATVATADTTNANQVAAVDTMPRVVFDTASTGPNRGTTVFGAPSQEELNANPRMGGVMGRESRTSVRAGEYYAAPWVGPVGGPSDAGQLIAPAAIPGIAQVSEQRQLTIGDRAYMTPPSDAVPARGDRYMTVALGPKLSTGGQVVTPTGVVEVERVSDGDAVTVRVVQQYRPLQIGDAVIPLEQMVMATGVRPTPLTLGPQATVIYVPSQHVLPSLLYYVVLDATLQDGVKVGDQFTLFRPRVHTDHGVTLPEEPIALAQVVRVTDHGVTGIIVDQRHPAIHEGTHARLTARMP